MKGEVRVTEVRASETFKERFASYPDAVRKPLTQLRDLIVECAEEVQTEKLGLVTKWGQQSWRRYHALRSLPDKPCR